MMSGCTSRLLPSLSESPKSWGKSAISITIPIFSWFCFFFFFLVQKVLAWLCAPSPLVPPPSNRGVPSLSHICSAPDRHFCCKRVWMGPESICPSVQGCSILAYPWDGTGTAALVPALSGCSSLDLVGKTVSFFLGKKIIIIKTQSSLGARSPEFLRLAYLTQDWDFFSSWGPKWGVEKLIKREEVGNQTNWDMGHAASPSKLGSTLESLCFSPAPAFVPYQWLRSWCRSCQAELSHTLLSCKNPNCPKNRLSTQGRCWWGGHGAALGYA